MAKAKETNINETDDLLTQVQNALSKTNDSSVKRKAEFDVQYPTGFLHLDYKNGQRINVTLADGTVMTYDSYGIVDGTSNMFIGRSGCGKSTLVYQIGANIIRAFKHGLMFVDLLEGGMMAKRTELLTGFTPEECDRRIKVRNAGITIESVYLQIKAIHDIKVANEERFRYDTGLLDSRGRPITKFQPTVYIIDSIPLLTSAKISEEEQLSGQMSTTATAKQLAQLFRRCNQLLKEANIILLAVNHITQKVEINAFKHTKSQTMYLKQDETIPGGVTPLYLANMVFRLDDGDKLTSDKEFGIDGCHVIVSNVKSRAGISGMNSAVDLVFNYNTGFDADLSLYMMLKNAGKVNGAGAYLYFADRDDMKFSQKQFKAKLFKDEEFLNVFANECFDFLKNELDMIEELSAMKSSSTTSMVINKLRGFNNSQN